MGTVPLIARLRADAWSGLPSEVADYVDAGSGAEVTAGEAVGAWDRYRFLPHVLRDVTTVDTSVEVLGTRLRLPILGAPAAYQRMVHPEGEAEMARGVAGAGGLLVVSTRSTVRLEEVAATACPWWFQVYVMRRRSLTEALVDRAVAAGAGALVLTGDTPYVGRKPRVAGGIPIDPDMASVNVAEHLLPGEDAEAAMDQDPAATLADIAWLAGRSGLPVLVKGVLRPDDALACLDSGAAGVIVSNHGGRQLDRAVPTAAALPAVVAAVAGRVPVLVDGGLRDGPSMLAALALGASAVLVGRPLVWALAAGGAPAVTGLLEDLRGDLSRAMALAGAADIGRLTPDLVVG
jgi:4-hydroxymandelate oxidase